MKVFILLIAVIGISLAQGPRQSNTNAPAGSAINSRGMIRWRRKALIQSDHKKNLADAAALVKLSEDLVADLQRMDENEISAKDIKRTADIEKLAKNVHGRLCRQ